MQAYAHISRRWKAPQQILINEKTGHGDDVIQGKGAKLVFVGYWAFVQPA
jgi:hypothetical protein